MRTIYLDGPLGMCNVYAPCKKEWILTALSTVGSLASSFFGGKKASEAAREQQRMLREQKAADDAGFTRQKYQNYIDTSSGQNLVRRAKQMYDRSIKRAAGAKAVAGGTDASVQMAKDSANQAMGDTIANIAALDTQRQDQIDREKRANDRAYTQQMAGIEAQRAQSISNAAQNASNAMMSAASALGQDGGVTKLKGGDNGGSINQNTASMAYNQAKIDAAKSNIGKTANDIEFLNQAREENKSKYGLF